MHGVYLVTDERGISLHFPLLTCAMIFLSDIVM